MIKIALLIVLLIFVGNMLFLDYVVISQQQDKILFTAQVRSLAGQVKSLGNSPIISSPLATPAAQVANNACPTTCLSAINSAVANIKPTSTQTAAATNKTTATTSTKGEYVIPLGSGQVDTIGSWTDTYSAQSIVDTTAYSNIKAIYFEVVMHIPNQQGEMKAKLIDDSTPFSYDGQVLSTTSGVGQILSVQVPLQTGKKIYHVQLYTSISSGVLDSARIRIVTQ